MMPVQNVWQEHMVPKKVPLLLLLALNAVAADTVLHLRQTMKQSVPHVIEENGVLI